MVKTYKLSELKKNTLKNGMVEITFPNGLKRLFTNINTYNPWSDMEVDTFK